MAAPGNITISGTASGNGKFNSNAQGGGTGDVAGYHSISGTGMGTNSTQGYYDDFESRTVGAVGTAGQTGVAIGSLIINSDCVGTSITTTNPSSGTKALKQNYASKDFPKIFYPLSSADYVYIGCKLRLDGAGPTVYKMSRAGANTDPDGIGGDVYRGISHAGSSYTAGSGSTVPGGLGGTFSGEIVTSNGITSYSANNTGTQDPTTAYKNGAYVFYEFLMYVGTVGNNDCFVQERVDNKNTLTWTNREYLTVANPPKLQWALTPLNGMDNPGTMTATIDNLYITTNLYRVMMTDSAVYSSYTKCEPQPYIGSNTTWSPTFIRTAKKRGSFAIGDTAYLHVFANNVLVKSTTSFLVTADNA